ncbi:MAG TPA: long-chain fatty acid--CoA ligase [Acidimicrobiia bacterium]|jgi:long-chain acyl-CoA synthetase
MRPALSAQARPWHSHYDDGVPPSLRYPDTTLDEVLRQTATRFPEQPALVFFGNRITYHRLDELVDRMASSLQAMGVRPGDRVAVFMPNCPQMVISYYGIWRAGGVVVPINPLYTGAEFERQVNDSGATTAIVLSAFYNRVKAVRDRTGVNKVVVTNIKEYFPPLLRALFTIAKEKKEGHRVRLPGSDDVLAFPRALQLGSDKPLASFSRPDETAALLYTGGTTGIPKGAVLSHRNLLCNAQQVGVWATGLDDGAEVMMSALPLSHCYAMTVCMNLSIQRGWAQVLLPDPRDLSRLLSEIQGNRVTILPGVPTLYAAIANHPDVRAGKYDVRSIEVCISGAAGLPSEVQAEFQRITGGRLVEGYGLTEASPVTHANPIGSGGRTGTIGLPLPDTRCKIVDVETQSEEMEPGRPGILCISGPQVMSGYWNRADETESTLRVDDDGVSWLHTGDVAEMSPDGYFRIIDRQKDMILAAGGLNVYPREIEDVLYQHPKVLQAAVIGVPVGGMDQRAKAFVVLREGQKATEEEILGYLGTMLARFKVPKSVEFREELPLAFTGKVLRRVLAEEERSKADREEVS